MKILHEMAFDRKEVIDRCFSNGQKFIEHFHKVMKEGKESTDYTHHCVEMQAFWNNVKKLVMKPRSKMIASDDLINWFFTAGSDITNQIEEPYQDIYEKLILTMLNDRDNADVKDILNKLI